MDTVLNIPEVVRGIVSHSSNSVMIFFSNRVTLEQEPCTTEYRTWAKRGCPDEHTCLSGIGGVESTFCVGRFLLTVGHEYLFYVEKSLAQLCSRLDTCINLHNDEFGTLHLTIDSGVTKIRMFTLAPDRFKAIISYSGWQRIENSITLTKNKTKSLLHKIMKTTGEVEVYWRSGSGSNLSFNLKRNLNLSVYIVDKAETQWNILQVCRVG